MLLAAAAWKGRHSAAGFSGLMASALRGGGKMIRAVWILRFEIVQRGLRRGDRARDWPAFVCAGRDLFIFF